ncbi:hypothetical protein CORC01_09940 [Colletotrichum orchidophilum]|uniref:Uncharacterized protein n=1 Tax=Colletotrichum orchidophilum TaxID=1209926 RepID=A0A1G4B062_9PEZI|nr:uncharacterized protein CORC01_09940 [Colletotrichum orchidophilum]OHE94723.1 hypothetical protein CORC01_09940 [Colletotrichum orchidophilum]
MQPTQLFSAIALMASAVVVDANPTPVLEAGGTGLERRVPKTSGAECIKAPLSDDKDHSYYTITIDTDVKAAAAKAGLSKIGIRQHCASNGGLFGIFAQNTENWGFVTIDKSGANQQYNITVDRCKKKNDRHVWSYNVWLCDDKTYCGTNNCGLDREICPEKKTKAVNLTDPDPWTCAV